jgi:hypothetical protein
VPNDLESGLQIQRGFVTGENHRVRCLLGDVDDFFSSTSSANWSFDQVQYSLSG